MDKDVIELEDKDAVEDVDKVDEEKEDPKITGEKLEEDIEGAPLAKSKNSIGKATIGAIAKNEKDEEHLDNPSKEEDKPEVDEERASRPDLSVKDKVDEENKDLLNDIKEIIDIEEIKIEDVKIDEKVEGEDKDDVEKETLKHNT